ncbi:MAG: ABC transporter ATP-binding protein [Burkholderiales bacterium]|nr:ABC transporter ATP-binding protein [Burkholderiales bacterium]MDE1927954.1 ABC transporter ATP-binding protein [Burkholderiales bacterium]MDE2502880.1 ABC transporter ATP-binding protein [Burkholderiales bacterium]
MNALAPDRLKLVGISKSFPGVRANDAVDLSVRPGEIHALLGENGAGKSTLVKIIYGIQSPDAGEIWWDGAPIRIASPRAARRLGIGMVFQHFSLFEAMTVLENISLGLDSKLGGRELEAEIARVLDTYQLKLDPRRIVSTLSVGERQRIEIVRALLLNPRLLVMDEPTSVLTPQEVEQLFETLRQLAASGCSVLYISHKLHEIVALCEGATILRGGKVVAHCDPRRETARSMAEMMIGPGLKELAKSGQRSFGAPRLQVQGLSLARTSHFGVALDGVTFEVRAGEIFGVAGVAGNGQNELLDALSGESLAPAPEAVLLEARPVGRLGVGRRRALGLRAVPEERNGHAAIGEFSLTENATLTGRGRVRVARLALVDAAESARYTREVIAAFDVKATGPEAPAGALSGGNLQKFIMGREILQHPSVLVVCQPTWGVDAGAAAAIHQAVVDLAARGSAVLVISQDLDELLSLCDTVAVLNGGRLSAPMKTGEVSIEALGLLMGGVHGDPQGTQVMTEHLHAHPI